MSLSKSASSPRILEVPDWNPPSKWWETVPRFKSEAERFGYNNLTASEVESHALLLAKCMPTVLLKVCLPFATFTCAFKDDVLHGLTPHVLHVFKADKGQGCFVSQELKDPRVEKTSSGCTRYTFHITEAIVGDEWDRRCFGLAIKFVNCDVSQSAPSRVSCTAESRKAPLCSFMLRKGESANRRLGGHTPLGYPVSAMFVGCNLYMCVGMYCGVGFGNDLTGCDEYLYLLSTILDRKGAAWSDPARYAKLCDKFPPFCGASGNCGSIAYVAGVSFKDDADHRVKLSGLWGELLGVLANDAGRPWFRDDSVYAFRYLRDFDYDDLYGDGHFMLVGCLETIVGAVAGEVIQKIIIPGSDAIQVQNDLGLTMRNCIRLRAR